MPMIVNPYASKLLTIWNLPPDPAAVVAAARLLRLDGVEIKTADGNSSWLGRRNVTADYVAALRAGGLRVLGWSYNYCDGEPARNRMRGDGFPEEEAEAAAAAVTALGLEGHTFDLEIECEGHADLVTRLLDRARSVLAVPIGAHVWADLAGHDRYPAAEILERVDVLRPMVYRPVWNAADCWASWGALVAGDPPVVCPVWGLTEGTAPDLADDMAFADALEIPGEAYWEYAAVAHLAPAVRELVAGRSVAPVVIDPITTALDGAWSISERLAAIEHRDIAVELQTKLVDLKQALGRQ